MRKKKNPLTLQKLAKVRNHTTSRQYVTIVNLTPHGFKLTYTHSCQMDEYNLGDFPSGRARQNFAHYIESGNANPIDDNGEACYDIGNTGKKFVVRVMTHIPDTCPKREYKAPEQEVPVTLVITGNDSFGFITSLSYGPGDYMNSTKDDINHRKLLDAIMPGTHDSDMSNTTEAILMSATESNTQTQGLSVYAQLRLRVSTVHEVTTSSYEYWTTHLSDEMAEVTIGRSGEKFDDVVSKINKVTSENPGEVIAIQFRGVRNVPSKGPVYWDETIKNKPFDKLIEIKSRCRKLDRPVQDYTTEKLMSSKNGKGCGDTKDVANFAIDFRQKKKNFHIGQWFSTPSPLTSTYPYSIQSIAVLPTNPALYWKGVNSINSAVLSNVLLADYIGILYTLAIGLNLYTISENCDINKRRSPLLTSPKNQRRPPKPLVSQFNGIIFANGTTIEHPPPGFHPERVEILRNGTAFSNGAVLKEDVPNPDLNSTLLSILRNLGMYSCHALIHSG
ncbi:uncharacterized protein LY79DRAFT_686694 [Colletotrichum navitas]|uniref:Uncharacterized protein n=1 Tax=Colletotrichum navitas TaxID=681940 RepID=A0AAD8V519_9PEZI|nr:uncharacterized protein LY79DRAFT_686694 [Colletotrichum navitas]KAK1590791.1 hypothetical protein LY79DRAFT_686694 [Colletotrichum navitas]